jgi:hypothetical protein
MGLLVLNLEVDECILGRLPHAREADQESRMVKLFDGKLPRQELPGQNQTMEDQCKAMCNIIVNYHIPETDLNKIKANKSWPKCESARDVHVLYQILTGEFLTRKFTVKELDYARFLIRFSSMRQPPEDALIDFKVQHEQSHSAWMSLGLPEMTPYSRYSWLS